MAFKRLCIEESSDLQSNIRIRQKRDSPRERVRTAAALLRVLWVFAGPSVCFTNIRYAMTALPERGGWEGVTEGTHASPLIGMSPECLLKAGAS